jgi:hypothetical protein
MYMLMTCLRIKKESDVHVKRKLDKMDRGMSLAAVGHHNNINKLMFQLANKTEEQQKHEGQWSISSKNFLYNSSWPLCPKSGKGFVLYGWRRRHRKG